VHTIRAKSQPCVSGFKVVEAKYENLLTLTEATIKK
jgi:hypothetical protein